jgi:hypothetical protein
MISFIQNPPFEVKFPVFVVNFPIITKKESSCKLHIAIEIIKCFNLALIEASIQTFNYSLLSFKEILIENSNLLLTCPWEVYLIGVDIIFLAVKICCYFITSLGKSFINKFSKNLGYLIDYDIDDFNKEINFTHLKTNSLLLDTSHVSKEININHLLKLFDQVNFSQPNSAGYMPPTAYQEEKKIYSVIELKKGLEVFIDRIKNRQPFLGTPCANNTVQLIKFYQQIEDAVRLLIDKIYQNDKEFEKKWGIQLCEYKNLLEIKAQVVTNLANDEGFKEKERENLNVNDSNQLNEYKNLLEIKARVVIDLAMVGAGEHCGGRCMAEVMSVYYFLHGASSKENSCLQEHLIELLAEKRRKIALRHIQKNFGSDPHYFSQYMEELGGVLGIPGTQNITEHLKDTLFNYEIYFKDFFNDYTQEVIIKVIQKEVKTSQFFREKIIDWIKTQLGDWKKEKYETRFNELFPVLTKLLIEKEEDVSESTDQLMLFERLVSDLNQLSISWPTETNWTVFLEELFALSEVKEWFNKQFPDLKQEDLLKTIYRLKSLCSEKVIGQNLVEEIKSLILENKPLPIKIFIEKFSKNKKCDKIRSIIALEKETIARLLTNETDLEIALKNVLNLEREYEFIENLKLEKLINQGLSQEMMEWLLVYHDILMPQIKK